MRSIPAAIGAVALVTILVPSSASAQGVSDSRPPLHVNTAYRSCFFQLHPELTREEFKEFAGEVGLVLRFRQMDEPRPSRRGVFEVGAQFTNTPIDDTKGAWNNTMSHPAADHYLGEAVALPGLVVRAGLSDRVALGAWGTFAPNANYGIAGIDSQILVLKQGPSHPVSLSVRPSISSLIGPSDVWAGNASIDVVVGRTFGAASSYVGFATSASGAIERSTAVDLRPVVATDSLAYVGLSYALGRTVVAAEVEKGRLVSYAVRIGRRF